MTDRLHCDAYHYSDGACCSSDEPCPLKPRTIRIEPIAPLITPQANALLQAALVVLGVFMVGWAFCVWELSEKEQAVRNQEQITWFKLERAVRK